MSFVKNSVSTEELHQMVYSLKARELSIVLNSVNKKKTGSKIDLLSRVLYLLTHYYSKTLEQKIIEVYSSSRNPQNHNVSKQAQSCIIAPGRQLPEPHPNIEFEHLPFFKTTHILLPYTYYDKNEINFTNLFDLNDNLRHSIANSWNKDLKEHTIQVIYRLVQVGLKENDKQRLPYNMTVSVNNSQCKLPMLNDSPNAKHQWRINIPIDITQQTDLKNRIQNKLQVTWKNEPYQYMAALFVAQKFTLGELLEQLNKRPMCPSSKTKEFIKNSMKSDDDMDTDSIVITLHDPLSKKRMQLPARSVNCKHLNCFDVIQFLQLYEQKHPWKCPICIQKVQFKNIEVDEYFLNILKSPNLSAKCENVILLSDGSWIEKQTKEFKNTSITKNKQSTNNINIFTLYDSDEYNDPPKVENSIVKSKLTNSVDLIKNDLLTEKMPSTSSWTDKQTIDFYNRSITNNKQYTNNTNLFNWSDSDEDYEPPKIEIVKPKYIESLDSIKNVLSRNPLVSSCTEKQTKVLHNRSVLNYKQFTNNIEVITLSDSNNEDDPPIKRSKYDPPLKHSKYDPPKVEISKVKSKHTDVMGDFIKKGLDQHLRNMPSTSSCTEKQTTVIRHNSISNYKQLTNNIVEFTLTDSDEEDDLQKVEQPKVKSKHIVDFVDLTKK